MRTCRIYQTRDLVNLTTMEYLATCSSAFCTNGTISAVCAIQLRKHLPPQSQLSGHTFSRQFTSSESDCQRRTDYTLNTCDSLLSVQNFLYTCIANQHSIATHTAPPTTFMLSCGLCSSSSTRLRDLRPDSGRTLGDGVESLCGLSSCHKCSMRGRN